MLLDLGETGLREYRDQGCNPFPAPVVLQHCRSFLFALVDRLFHQVPR